MRKTIKVFRDEGSKENLFEKLVAELNKDGAKQVIVLSQEYTKIFAMYKTDNTKPLIPGIKIDGKKQAELLEESISDEVLANNGGDNAKSDDQKEDKKESGIPDDVTNSKG